MWPPRPGMLVMCFIVHVVTLGCLRYFHTDTTIDRSSTACISLPFVSCPNTHTHTPFPTQLNDEQRRLQGLFEKNEVEVQERPDGHRLGGTVASPQVRWH